ncbi:LysR substrate-binding domain-containing protein [Cellulomonas endophytica]|uniref:LysR substrate-binding domain-containing protein n=1 Tax=Cellulomonas endophytica TaxID=2494735 RepID=UPI001012F9AC|nr:LysR substrate-binding domain-containing protein [Cellulomonas endophytica]
MSAQGGRRPARPHEPDLSDDAAVAAGEEARGEAALGDEARGEAAPGEEAWGDEAPGDGGLDDEPDDGAVADGPGASDDGRAGFRLLLAPGVHPDRWVRVWAERVPQVRLDLEPCAAAEALRAVQEGRGDAALAPVPPRGTPVPEGLAAVRLYEEVTVVVVPKDHWVTLADEVPAEDLAEETLLVPADDVLGVEPAGRGAASRPASTADAVELVAAGVGVVLLPLSLARLHARADVRHRPVVGAPTVTVGLVWAPDGAADPVLTEELVGIVRGRTARSSRGGTATSAVATGDGDPGGGDAGGGRGGVGRGRGGAGGAAAGARGRGGAGGGAAGGGGGAGGGAAGGGGRGRGGAGGGAAGRGGAGGVRRGGPSRGGSGGGRGRGTRGR